MNLGDVMRELGLDSLVPPSQTNDSEGNGEDAEAADGTTADETNAETDTERYDGSDDESEDGSGLRVSTDAFEGDVGDAIDELRYDLDELEGQVDDNTTTIGTLENEQNEITDRLDEIQETNATLLGVYDRLVDDINPFSGVETKESAGPDDETYGVMSGSARDEDHGNENGTEEADDGTDDEVVSFEDVKSSAAESEDSATSSDETDAANPAAIPASASDSGDSPYLDTLAPTYATDVVLMQWVSMLVDTAGPAGALKTIDYYAQIDWISPRVKRQVETVLSGAYDIDSDQPSQTPSELPVEAHSESFEHIQKLAQQTELARS